MKHTVLALFLVELDSNDNDSGIFVNPTDVNQYCVSRFYYGDDEEWHWTFAVPAGWVFIGTLEELSHKRHGIADAVGRVAMIADDLAQGVEWIC